MLSPSCAEREPSDCLFLLHSLPLPIRRGCRSECGGSNVLSEKLPVWGPWRNRCVPGEFCASEPDSFPTTISTSFSLGLLWSGSRKEKAFSFTKSLFWLLHPVTGRVKLQVETCLALWPTLPRTSTAWL